MSNKKPYTGKTNYCPACAMKDAHGCAPIGTKHTCAESDFEVKVETGPARPHIRTGDTVRVKSVGEDWQVAYVEKGKVYCVGWPLSAADVDDCTVTKRATDEQYVALVHALAKMGSDPRGTWARSQLEQAAAATKALDELGRALAEVHAKAAFASLPPGVGAGLFLFVPSPNGGTTISWASNCHRRAVIAALREYLATNPENREVN